MESSGRLITTHTFGIQARRNCLASKDEHHLAYVCGNSVVIVNLETKDQHFIPGTTSPFLGLGITAIACHQKRTLIVAERAAEHGVITFYDAHTLKKKKSISSESIGSTEIVAMSISEDGKFFVAQGGAPDWNLSLWNIEKAPKLLTILKVTSQHDQYVSNISICPYDSSVVAVFGKKIGKLFRWSEGSLKPMGMSLRRDNANVTSHSWLPDERCIIGTEAGELLLIDNFDFKAIVYPCGSDGEDLVPVLCLQPTSRGFVMGTVSGEIRLFEKAEDLKEQYSMTQIYCLPGEGSHVISVLNGQDDNLVCLTDSQQLFSCPLYGSNVPVKNGTPQNFDNLASPFHTVNDSGSSEIVDMDIALWRPYLVTVARDNTVRVWNLHSKRMEVVKQFSEDPVAVGIHPNGLSLVVAFIDKLVIMSILLNELCFSREVSIRQCNSVKFSKSGSHIAASSGSAVVVVDMLNGDVISTLRGHVSKIKSISWMHLDSIICTVGSEGAVFYWDVHSGVKKQESLNTPFPLTGGAGFGDRSRVFVSTPEKTVKEMVVVPSPDADPQAVGETREVSVGSSITSMLVDDTRHMVYAATCDENKPNAILTFTSESNLSSVFETHRIHSGRITCMVLSRDGSTVYSGDSHGTIFISEVQGVKQTSRDAAKNVTSNFAFVEEIMVRRNEFEEKKVNIARLSHNIEEMTVNNEHQLRVKEMDHKKRIRQISDENVALLATEREKFATLSIEKKTLDDDHYTHVEDLELKQERKVMQTRHKYEAKLKSEEQRQEELRVEILAIQKRWNAENEALVESHQDYVRELTEEYDEKIRMEKDLTNKVYTDKATFLVEFADLNVHVDNDADEEMDEMKVKYAHRLKYEEDTVKASMAEHEVLRKSLQNLMKDAGRQKDEVKKLRDRQGRLHDAIVSIDKDITNHKKEVRERDDLITDKEKRIFDLKKKNQELEKFRFVLDYKIKELRMQIAPREKEIVLMTQQIDDMRLEVDQYHKSNAALNLMISELKLKADGMRRELITQSERQEMNLRVQTNYQKDLMVVMEVRDQPKLLKAQVVAMYRRYVQYNSDSTSSSKPGKKLEDPQLIYNRDREQLERSLDALRRATKGDAVMHERDVTKMSRENVIMTNELNDLRKNCMSLSLKKKAIEECGALHGGKNFGDIFHILGCKDPREKLKKEREKEKENRSSQAGGIFATEGVVEMIGDEENRTEIGPSSKPPAGPGRPPLRSRSANPRSPRTVALKQGRNISTSPNKRRRPLSNYNGPNGPNGNIIPANSDQGDQWAAWREIQMQNDQLQSLEEKLHEVCGIAQIDPVEVLQKLEY